MKKLGVLSFLLTFFSSMAFAQLDLAMNYTYSRPQNEMGRYINQAHGLQGQFLYTLPKTRFAIGTEAGISSYGYQTTNQTYRFSDGSTTQTDVHVSNNFLTLHAVGRLDLISSGNFIPYLMGKAGYNLYWTNLNIENPDDPDGCKPLENKSLLTDGAFAASGGGGVRWDLSSVFKKFEKGRFYTDLSAHYIQGGRVKYMNVNIPPVSDPEEHQHHTTTTSGDVVSYSARFINPVNQIVHAHHVGDVYTSFIQSMEFKLGIAFRINP